MQQVKVSNITITLDGTTVTMIADNSDDVFTNECGSLKEAGKIFNYCIDTAVAIAEAAKNEI